ncbi:hypothetical protein KO489_03950 [Reinekea forsetii]|nr:hypothetical protein [Reinekea forsetii]
MLSYLYAVFDLPSVTLLALIAIKCLPNALQIRLGIAGHTKLIVWHYFGLLSLIVITSYLLGVTKLYELGYSYLALIFILPMMIYAIVTAHIAITVLIIGQVGVWLVFYQSYINLWDALVGELLLISYLALLATKLVKLTVKIVKKPLNSAKS